MLCIRQYTSIEVYFSSQVTIGYELKFLSLTVFWSTISNYNKSTAHFILFIIL